MKRKKINLRDEDKIFIKKTAEKHMEFKSVSKEIKESGYELSDWKLRKILRELGITKFTRSNTQTNHIHQFSIDDNDENNATYELTYENSNLKTDLSKDNYDNSAIENILTQDEILDTKESNNIEKHTSDILIEKDNDIPTININTSEDDACYIEESTYNQLDNPPFSIEYTQTTYLESLLTKLDVISNDILYLLEEWNIIKKSILTLEEKNPNKIITQQKNDFIRIYASPKESTTINLNLALKKPIKALASKFGIENNFSDAVNLALLIALYSEFDDEY